MPTKSNLFDKQLVYIHLPLNFQQQKWQMKMATFIQIYMHSPSPQEERTSLINLHIHLWLIDTHLCLAKMPPYTCGPTLFTSFSSRLKNGYRVGYFRHRGRDSLLGMGEETMKELLTLVMAQTATQSETTTQANVWRNKPLSHSILNLLQYFRLFLYV